MSNQPLQQPITLEGLVKRSNYTERFKQVLGEKAPQFMSSLLSIGRNMPDVEPNSIVAGGMKAAALDLPIDPSLGFAWIVPYRDGDKKYAQFQIGSKGFIQLAQRSGYYSRMNARAIHKEAFKGFDDVGEPVIDWDAIDDTKEPAGYVFAFRLLNGFTKTSYWSRGRVEAHAKRYSQAFRKGFGPWKDNFHEMALKTVIKNELSDWGILSVQFLMAKKIDQGVLKDAEEDPEHLDNPAIDVPAEVEPGNAASEQEPTKLTPTDEKKPDEKKPDPEKVSPQNELAQFVVGDLGHTFDTFRKWAHNSGMVENVMDMGSFQEIPSAACNRCLRAKTGLKQGLDKVVLG